MSQADLQAQNETASPAGVKAGGRLMDKQWETVQRKTFTKWVNSQLQKRKMNPIENMAEEFSDGAKLIALLEIIGGEDIGKYYKAPKLRVQKCENMNKALDFIKNHGVNLTNIGAEDLVDKNEKLVLGMVWTIILRFTIAEISEEGLSAKEGLLLWCQRKTQGYKNVNVRDFTFSWQDGLAFCALIHRHRPDLLDFDKLSKSNKKENVQLAFDIAEQHLGIPKLLDVEDLVDITKPDERSVMTYVAQYFHAFSKLDSLEVAGRRVGKFANVMKATWEMKNDYERRAGAFIKAIADITSGWQNSSFDDSYADAKLQSNQFQEYKNTQKRQWVAEKRDLDTLLSNIQTKLRTYNLTAYNPPEGLTLTDVDNSWNQLLTSEGVRRKAINEKIAAIKYNLRSNYAQLANAFERELNQISQSLGNLDGDLQQQLEQVKQISEKVTGLNQSFDQIKVADEQCDQAGIEESEREDTVFSVEDLEFDFQLVQQACQKKIAFIENQVVARNMTNITPQQLEEFETTFKAFDKNNSNTLQFHEFKACLASLGKAYDDNELTDLFKKLNDNGDYLTFEQFSKFMVSITEDRTSVEQLRQSFQSISKSNNGVVTEQQMRQGQVPAEQIDYLKTVMPKAQNGAEDAYDYEAYLSNVFASQKSQ
ncbi:hypothetical protein MIR68_011772 [Amoeboaphelidium protococcarum]|nr:hypothetical protein MIR68_011772 [Amoeboaphelidium protococcarum]